MVSIKGEDGNPLITTMNNDKSLLPLTKRSGGNQVMSMDKPKKVINDIKESERNRFDMGNLIQLRRVSI